MFRIPYEISFADTGIRTPLLMRDAVAELRLRGQSPFRYFADKSSKVRKPCHANSKWRKPLEDAGVTFDKNDFVKDWEHAKNPL